MAERARDANTLQLPRLDVPHDSSVDDSFADGIGKRLDGWANTDLNVGAIVALSPALDPGLKAELNAWGPGKYDPRHHAFDGTNIIGLNTPSLPIVIPPIYGLKKAGFETFTGDGPISYWNSYVGVSQMGGHGSFHDSRIGLKIEQEPDLVTPKLPALLAYQLSLRTPEPPAGRLDRAAATRGKQVFRLQGRALQPAVLAESDAGAESRFAGVPAVALIRAPGADTSMSQRSPSKDHRRSADK